MHVSSAANAIPVIYRILSLSSNEQLSPLVDTLTETPLSILKITRAYERHAPDHGRYADQIGDEIYRLGQKALGITDGSRPSYRHMIATLCKQLGLLGDNDDLANGETALLNLFTPRRLLSIDADKQQDAVNDARKAAAKGAMSFFGADERGPLAACLLQIAFLRGTFGDAAGTDAIAGVENGAAGSRTTTAAQSNALVMSTDEGTPLLTLSRIHGSDEDDGWRAVSKNDTEISRLNPLLQAVPSLATAMEVGANNYMNVIVPAGTELVNSVKKGGMIGTIRDVVTGKFAGAAKLDAGNLSALASSGAALNIASALLAQKHLADISRKLSEIRDAIEDVAAFQTKERRSVLTGSIRYFEQVAPSVLESELSDEVLNAIEMHEARLLQIQDHLAGDIRDQMEALKVLKDEKWIGQSKYVKALKEQQETIDRLYREMLLCLRARACGWQLLCAFPDRRHRKESRLQDMRTSVTALQPRGNAAVALDLLLREKIKTISSAADRFKALVDENAFLNRISDQCALVIGGLETSGRDISVQDTPFSMDLKVENGVIVATRMR